MRGLGLVGDPDSTMLGDTNKIVVYRIPYHATELKDGGYPTESGSPVDIAGSNEFDVAWHYRQQALMQILGFAWRDIRTTGGSGPGIRRFLPEYQPDYMFVDFGGSVVTPYLLASKATIKPVGPQGFTSLNMASVIGEDTAGSGSGSSGDAYGGLSKDNSKFHIARIKVDYDYPPYDVLPDPATTTTLYTVGTSGSTTTETLWTEYYNGALRWVSFEMKPAAEYLSVPPTVNTKDPDRQNLRWADNKISSRVGTPFPGNVGHIVGNIDFKFTWHQVPFNAIPLAHIQSTIGRVNLRSLTLPGGQTIKSSPGQLLMLAVDMHRAVSPLGNRLWNVEYTLRYSPRGHNNFYDYVSGGWYQASKDGLFYGYAKADIGEGMSGYIFTPTHGTQTGTPPPGKLLYDSVDYNYLFTPE